MAPRRWRSAPSPGTSSTAATSRPTRRFTRGARALRRTTERNATHVQVNRELREEFAAVLCGGAVGRRAPPGVPAALVRGAGRRLQGRGPALAHLTQLAWPPCAAPLARWNPDLLGSWEGGSNLTLVRGPDHGRLRRPSRARAAPPSGATDDGLRQARLGPLRGEPPRQTAPPARGARRAPRCRGGRRLGRRFAADPRAATSTSARARRGLFEELADEFGLSGTDRPRCHRPPPGPRARDRRAGPPPGRPRRGRCPASGLATPPLGPRPGRSARFATRNGSTARVARSMR